MLSRIAGLVRNNRGQSLVEFALALPLLLILVLGIINFGMIAFYKMQVTQAAREGARAAAISGISADADAAVKNINSSFKCQAPIPGNAGDPVTVTVSGQVDIIAPGFTTFLQNPFPVTSKSSMRLECSPPTAD